MIENYSIHNLVKFQLVNQLKSGGLFQRINPEYEYFRVKDNTQCDFKIIVGNILPREGDGIKISESISVSENKVFYNEIINKNFVKLELKFESQNPSRIIIDGTIHGIRKLLKYSVLKNLYVRPLISHHLIQNNSALIHSAGVSFNDNGTLFVGRPGVFKTSILMDMIRKYGAGFLGEENTLVKNGMIYPFPLNIESLKYKLRYFVNENASSLLQKFLLGANILRRNYKYDVSISKPIRISNVMLMEKGNAFKIERSELNNNVIEKFVENEKLEFDIPPTHSLTGISKINYNDLLKAYNKVNTADRSIDILEKLKDIIVTTFKHASIYEVTVPPNYSNTFTTRIFEKINE